MISCCDLWPWTKPGYITMTRRQSNNQWSGGIAAHPAPKNSECKNPLENFSPGFFGIKTAFSPSIIFQKAKLLTRSITHLCWCTVVATVRLPRGSCSCTTIPRLTGHLQPASTWPTWTSNVLITHSSLPISLHRTTACSPDWKTIDRSPFFVRRGGHCCRGDLVGRKTFWFFFSGPCKS